MLENLDYREWLHGYRKFVPNFSMRVLGKTIYGCGHEWVFGIFHAKPLVLGASARHEIA